MSAILKALCTTVALLTLILPANAERRVALVVGNAAYVHATRLANPVNDAIDIAAKLEGLGFDVTRADDQTSDKFFDAVQSFANNLPGADIALFYYSGHGVQFEGTNYLVPIDTKIDGAFALKRKAVSAQDVVEQMERHAKVSLVFLDACRNNTLLRDLEQSLPALSRSASNRGLGRMDPRGSNTLIVFATAPNDVAADGTGSRNSPFTAALLKHIGTPGVVVQEMLTDVTADVERATNGRQRPEVLQRLTSKVRLAAAIAVPVQPPPVVPVTPAPHVAAAPSASSKEGQAAVAWEAVKATCDRGVLTAFRSRYGDTLFGDLAKKRADSIEAGSACKVVAPVSPPSKSAEKSVEPPKKTAFMKAPGKGTQDAQTKASLSGFPKCFEYSPKTVGGQCVKPDGSVCTIVSVTETNISTRDCKPPGSGRSIDEGATPKRPASNVGNTGPTPNPTTSVDRAGAPTSYQTPSGRNEHIPICGSHWHYVGQWCRKHGAVCQITATSNGKAEWQC